MKKLIFLLSIPLISFGQSIDQEEDLPALRLSNNFSKPYRVLKTTISDKSLFQQYYNNTNLTLDYVIRYHFYTSIDLNSEKITNLDNLSEDLTAAARHALIQMIDYIVREHGLTREQAYILCSVAVDLRVGQVVDVPNFVVTAVLNLDVFDKYRN